jgi:hypothetical protein
VTCPVSCRLVSAWARGQCVSYTVSSMETWWSRGVCYTVLYNKNDKKTRNYINKQINHDRLDHAVCVVSCIFIIIYLFIFTFLLLGQ